MGIMVGSARMDERGKFTGGAKGDQTGKEVSIQPFYMHKKGLYVNRPKSIEFATRLAQSMLNICNNDNIGYSQGDRFGIVTALKKFGSILGIGTKVNADCSTAVRSAILDACGIDVGNFTTANEVSVLDNCGLFEKHFEVTKDTILYDGDVLTTKTKGHTLIVVSGNPRNIVDTNKTYTLADFISDSERIWNTKDKKTMIQKSVTVSMSVNKAHAIVTPLERYMKALGYYTGTIEADRGKTPVFGAGMRNAIKLYQRDVVKATVKNQDGVLSAKGNTWKTLYR